MSNHQIQCVVRNIRRGALAPQERITHICGKNFKGTEWKLSQAEAIHCIETGRWRFSVLAGERLLDVVIAHTVTGHKYLKTEIDIEQPDHLLALPECN